MSKSEKSKTETKIASINLVGCGTTICSLQTISNRFLTELEGQKDFYNKFKSYIPVFKDLSADEIMGELLNC